MVFDKNKTYQNLLKKGFSEFPKGDHIVLEYWVDGKIIAHTKLSHGSKKDLDSYLIRQMSTQCKLTKKEFADLVNCPLSAEAYRDKLQEKGLFD